MMHCYSEINIDSRCFITQVGQTSITFKPVIRICFTGAIIDTPGNGHIHVRINETHNSYFEKHAGFELKSLIKKIRDYKLIR